MRVIAPNGYVIEASGEAELGAVLRIVGAVPGSNGAKPQARQTKTSAPAVQATQGLADRPLRLLTTLAEAGETGLTDSELRRVVAVTSNNGLAGVLASISRNAKTHGLTMEQVLTKEALAPGGPDRYRFRVTPRVQELLQAA